MNNKDLCIMFSHNTDDWRTPSFMYECFINKGYIDPFPFLYEGDNFGNIYHDEKIYINPPFSKLRKIPQFIRNNLNCNKCIYLLMPSRTDTSYFNELLELSPTIYFIKGRLHFNDSNGSAPFPTILLKFMPKSFVKLPLYFSIAQEYINDIII